MTTIELYRDADHMLAMPASTPDAEALERDRARRVVQRLAGDNAADILDALGLTEPLPANVEPPTAKRCSRCRNTKPLAEFQKRADSADGLYAQCRSCHYETSRRSARARYARVGYRGIPGGDGNICWKTASRGGRGVPRTAEALERRRTTYADLRVEEQLTPRQAAERMQISMRTARRIDAYLTGRGYTKTLAGGLARPAQEMAVA